jgi:hypothetical protein
MRRLLKRISIACVGLVVFACPSLLADSMPTVGASVAGLVAYCDGANIVQVDYSKGGANFASVADGRSRSGDCGVPPDNFATGFDARSVAYASGTLKASIFTLGDGTGGGASAAFFNIITLVPPAGFAGNSIEGDVTMNINGRTSPNTESGRAYGVGCLSLEPGGQLCTPGLQNSSGGPVSGSVTLTFELPLSDLTLGIAGTLSAAAANGGSADFGGTSETSVTLPPGWTYTSALGEFGIPPAVPEPSTLLLLGTGLLGLILAERQKFLP